MDPMGLVASENPGPEEAEAARETCQALGGSIGFSTGMPNGSRVKNLAK